MNKKVFHCLFLSIKCAVILVLSVCMLACEKADLEAEPGKDMHDTPIDISGVIINSVVIYEDQDDLNPFKRHETTIGTINCSVAIEYLICNSEDPSVIVFREIPKSYKKYNVRIGGAYLWSQNNLQYIKTVDLSLSSIQIAESYGVHPKHTKEVDVGSYARGKMIDKNTGEAKNAVIIPDLNITITAGENWQGEGVFIR